MRGSTQISGLGVSPKPGFGQAEWLLSRQITPVRCITQISGLGETPKPLDLAHATDAHATIPARFGDNHHTPWTRTRIGR
jgi:hypothetical protein